MQAARTKVLFIALSASTHTHSWVSLLDARSFDVRLFGLPITAGPASAESMGVPVAKWRSLGARIGRKVLGDQFLNPYQTSYLTRIVRQWKPDVIHTLGLDPAGYFFLYARSQSPLLKAVPWIATARGGPELALSRLVPDQALRIRSLLNECDQFIADNQLNYSHALDLGLDQAKVSALGVTPGTGGVDVEALASMRQSPASASRMILFPKAYECPASKALPVFESLRLAWDQIQPCEVHLTALIPETRMWFATLPESIRRCCHLYDRIPRQQLLLLMARARVVLAPSLTDGIPNTLYESMALGAAPIVSPIDTLRNIFVDGINVIYARNLYPDELAQALIRAMNDDALVDAIAASNRSLVHRLASRDEISRRAADCYTSYANRFTDHIGSR
jgi:hypothetical protein